MTRVERDRLLAIVIGVSDRCEDPDSDEEIEEALELMTWDEGWELARRAYMIGGALN